MPSRCSRPWHPGAQRGPHPHRRPARKPVPPETWRKHLASPIGSRSSHGLTRQPSRPFTSGRSGILLAPSRRTRTWVEQFSRMVVEAHAAGAVVARICDRLAARGRRHGWCSGDRWRDPGAERGGHRPRWSIQIRWLALREAGFAAAARGSWDAVAKAQPSSSTTTPCTQPMRWIVRPTASAAVGLIRAAGRDRRWRRRPFALPCARITRRRDRSPESPTR